MQQPRAHACASANGARVESGVTVSSSGARDIAPICRDLRILLDDLGLTPPITPQRLADRWGDRNMRPVEMVGRALPPSAASGIVIEYEHKDLIVYQSATSEVHQNHIAFHELAHLIWKHSTGSETPLCGTLLGPEALIGGRSLYDAQHEWEAESAATILSSWADASLVGPSNVGGYRMASAKLGSALGLCDPWQ